jgi:flagellar protein FliS
MQQVYAPYRQYQKQQQHEVLTASPVKLVGMLLEGAILFNKRAAAALEDGRNVNALEFADRACKIVMHLYNSLDFDKGGDVAVKLGSLYSYLLDQYADFTKPTRKPGALSSINNVLSLILDGWKQIEGKQNDVGKP